MTEDAMVNICEIIRSDTNALASLVEERLTNRTPVLYYLLSIHPQKN